MLLQQLLYDGANRMADKTAFHWVERERGLTYSEATTAMERVAGALAAIGVERGDRVGVFAHNGLDYLLAMFGTWRVGAISALINVQYAERLNYYVNDSQSKVLIYTGDHHETIERWRPSLASVEHYVCLDGARDGSLAWADLLQSASPPPPDMAVETDIAHLSYTSGTSGDPKGACLAHEPTVRATRCIAERLRIESSDVSLGPTALSSSYHLVANLLPGMHRTATTCVMTRWEAEKGWAALDDLGTTILAANPAVLRDILGVSKRRGRTPARLRLGISGGAPVPSRLKLSWRDELGLPLAESYGQSEVGGFVGLAPPKLIADDKVMACGPPLPDKEVRILDDDGNEASLGSTGEICLRGGYMAGYWRRPEKTAQTLRGGWLHTGDVGYVDADQYVYVRGRLSERLLVAGEYLYSRDVEEALTRHQAVVEAALIGLPDDELGLRPVAYVSVQETGDDPDRLARFAEEELGRSIPGFTVRTIEAMPMTPTGKISKAQLLATATAR